MVSSKDMEKKSKFVITDIRLEAENPDHTQPLGRKLSKAAKNGKAGRAWGKGEFYEENGRRGIRITFPPDKEFAAKGYSLLMPKDGVPFQLPSKIETIVAKEKKKE